MRTHKAKNFSCMTKRNLQNLHKGRNLGLGQIWNKPRDEKNMAKVEKSGIGMFLQKLMTDVKMSCKYCI